jgi:hypothetical protein
MSTDASKKPSFHIGLAMAGAVSAGAYSAGVFDFLIEALSEWQKAKERGEDVPKHDVFISTISGTSAGGIVGALGVASLAGGVRPTEQPAVNPRQQWPVKRVLPELYDAWVKKTKLFDGRDAKQGGHDQSLLDPSDLRQSKDLPLSLLNSDALTAIARESLRAIRPTGERYAFLSNPTHLFLTRTNLDGVPYPIMFEGSEFWMNLHEDRAHFAVANLGTRDFPEEECRWLKTWDDAGLPIDFKDCGDHGEHGGPLGDVLESYAQAALTTSAFPFGFQAREISVRAEDIRRRALPFDAGTYPEMLRQLQLEPEAPGAPSSFICIDGGALNNEPFELARWTIRNLDETQNSRDPKSANRAVILIAPFPPAPPAKLGKKDLDKASKSRKEDLALLFVARSLIPALVDQARFKSSDLIAAADPKIYSRHLISPSRGKPKPTSPDEAAQPDLACGLLYAFGGFLDEQFREHDFQLGRRNCQKFLRDHFRLHPQNPIFGEPASAESAPHARRPIIPLVGTAAVEVQPPPWPAIPERALADLRAALRGRLNPLVARFVGHFFRMAPLMRLAIQIYWWRRRHTLIGRFMDLVEERLDDTNQIDRTRPPGFWMRLKTWLGLGGKSAKSESGKSERAKSESAKSKAAADQPQPVPDQRAT